MGMAEDVVDDLRKRIAKTLDTLGTIERDLSIEALRERAIAHGLPCGKRVR